MSKHQRPRPVSNSQGLGAGQITDGNILACEALLAREIELKQNNLTWPHSRWGSGVEDLSITAGVAGAAHGALLRFNPVLRLSVRFKDLCRRRTSVENTGFIWPVGLFIY